MEDNVYLMMDESRMMDMSDRELDIEIGSENAVLRFISNLMDIIERVFKKVFTKQCPVCEGSGEVPLSVMGEKYWFGCGACNGDGWVFK